MKCEPKKSEPILEDFSAEIAFLGSILLMPDVCDDLALALKADDFYNEANRVLYQHMMGMIDIGQKIDATLLVNRLKTMGDYEATGGSAYLAQLANSVPNAAHVHYYAEIVRSKVDSTRAV